MDFRNYVPPDGNEPEGDKEVGKDDLNQAMELLRLATEAFSGKGEGDVWKDILRRAQEGKRNGTLKDEDLDNFFATVAPVLDGAKKRYLQQVITQLKNLN